MQKVIKAIKDCVASQTCCEETGVNCNQGRKCPVREGTHKPAEAVHQIQEPTPVTAMDALREAEAALEVAIARILKADPGHSICVTSEAKALVAVRAALAATPAAAPVIPSELIEAVDAWFAQNTGLGGCSDKDVAELAAIFAAAAPVTLPEPVPTPCRSMFATQREYADAMAQHRKNWEEIEAERALLATGGQAQAVRRGEVLVTVSGFTGSGKSAIAGEIEILCRALGLQVEWPDGESEKNMTHADWTAALEQYKPRVRIVEQNIPFVSKKGLSK